MMNRESEWYLKDTPRLMKETDILYHRIVETRPDATKLSITKQKIIETRNWLPSLARYDSIFEGVLASLEYFYIPKIMTPGPLFVFPVRDVTGEFVCAQSKPIEGSAMYGKTKYRYIGERPKGPRWLGNDEATLQAIIKHRCVMIVEGPFDLLAVRLLCPEIPAMSPLTKYLGKHHVAYLRMLGVQNIVLMYDNEESRDKDELGAGNVAMEYQSQQFEEAVTKNTSIKSMNPQSFMCSSSDASEALENDSKARQLRERIMKAFPEFFSIKPSDDSEVL